MADDAGRILSVRLRHPDGDRDLTVRIRVDKASLVDAVFTTVYAVKRILIPAYDSKEKQARLLKDVTKQQLNEVCFVLHKRVCGTVVPSIDWDAPSPIVLTIDPEEWF